jgi:hypothetical protein
MNRLTLFLDWLDTAAGGLIRVAYLLAGVTAVAVYFGAGNLPAQVEGPLNAALPWALSVAVELHTYITARRVRSAWQDHAAGVLKVNLAILAGLLAFSAWNQLGYLSETWHPPTSGALALPSAAAYLVRALVVPAAFMAAAFLAPMAEPITAQIEAEARATLTDVFKIARQQRRRMLKEAERSGRDMTGALVELVPDPEVRRIISHAYGAIGAPVTSVMVPATLTETTGSLLTAPQEASHVGGSPQGDRPPTGPGSPTQRRASKRPAPGKQRRPEILRLEPPESAETRIRAVLDSEPHTSIRQLAQRAAVSESTASKYKRLIRLEAIHGQAAQ